MRKSARFIAAGTAALMLATLSAVPAVAAGEAVPAGHWGNALEVPGSMKLNQGNDAALATVSCGAAGNCAAGGSYTDVKGHVQPFLVSQRNGHWSRAFRVRGALSVGPFGGVQSVSCAGPGDCTAAGDYAITGHSSQAFVVTERNGLWGSATKVPGLAALNTGDNAAADLVSCSSPGNCGVLGAYYSHAAHNEDLFAVSQRRGRWGQATPLRGLGSAGTVDINSLSCGAVGDCTVGGLGHDDDAIVMTERRGHWASAITVPGMAALNTGDFAEVQSVSCPAAGTCTAVGWYATSKGYDESFVANQRRGSWHRAFELPDAAALPGNHHAVLYFVSCAAVGDCSVSGENSTTSGQEVFVAGERNGVWGKPAELPGMVALNAGDVAGVGSMSCGAPGDCAIGGSYTDISKDTVAYLASEQNGRWSKAIEAPSASLLDNGSYSYVAAMSCKGSSWCSAGGPYYNGEGLQQVFVVSRP